MPKESNWPERATCPLTRDTCLMRECALFARIEGKGFACGLTGCGRLRVLEIDANALNGLERLVLQGGGTLYASR